MSCLSSSIIQKYIDGEASLMEATMVETHLVACGACSLKVADGRRSAANLKSALDILVPDDAIKVPVFNVPAKKRSLPTAKVLILVVSAACILAFILMVPYFRNHKAQEQITLVHCIEQQEVDANRSISEQQIVINVIDKDGRVTEFSIE